MGAPSSILHPGTASFPPEPFRNPPLDVQTFILWLFEIPSNPPNVSFFNSWTQKLLAGEHVGFFFWSYIRAVLPVPAFPAHSCISCPSLHLLPFARGAAGIQLMQRAQEAPPEAGRALFQGKVLEGVTGLERAKRLLSKNLNALLSLSKAFHLKCFPASKGSNPATPHEVGSHYCSNGRDGKCSGTEQLPNQPPFPPPPPPP